jgi:phage I-like protein
MKLKDRRGEFSITLQSIGEGALTDEFQMILPVGTFHSYAYGKMDITKEFIDKMVANYTAKVLGNRAPFIDTDHDQGAANGWITALQSREDGLYARIEWTDKGKQLIEAKAYQFFSAHFGEVVDIKTGDPVYPVLIAASLTNTPVMNTMPPARLSEGDPAHGDRGSSQQEGSMKTLSEVLAVLFALAEDEFKKATKDEKDKVAKAFGLPIEGTLDATLSDKVTKLEASVSLQKQQVETLLAENKEKGAEVATLKAKLLANEKNEVIEKALSEGRITPKTKEKWEALFAKDPEGTKALLAEQPPVVDMSTRGTGDAGTPDENGWTPEEKKLAAKAGVTDKTIKEFGPK